jgi:hypothetical protein
MIRTAMMMGTIACSVAFVVGFATGWKLTLMTVDAINKRKNSSTDDNHHIH